jgi:tripartite-type tricarboxylate transporter receptor subunit TctC
VPTLAEAGFPDANLASTFGLFAPGRTPPQTVARLNRAFNAALRDPSIQRRLHAVGNLPTGGSVSDFAAQIARDRGWATDALQDVRPRSP